ncbi:hypothetical protein N9164_06235 [Draconibacterium sp.]|nr:hypothetical protein [Draconibacterium sp.]
MQLITQRELFHLRIATWPRLGTVEVQRQNSSLHSCYTVILDSGHIGNENAVPIHYKKDNIFSLLRAIAQPMLPMPIQNHPKTGTINVKQATKTSD